MRKTALLLTLLVSVGFTACGRGRPPAGPAPIAQLQITDRVFYDDDVGLRDSTTAVIMTADSLQRIWGRITSTQSTAAPLSSAPKLAAARFPTEMLLLVAAGRQRREDGVRIDSVGVRREKNAAGRDEDVLIVQYTIMQGCRRFTDPAYPLEIVSVRRHNGPVRFMGKREVATNCR
jgi:hypothetical protein